MTQLILQIPDDIAQGLAGIASAQQKTVEGVAQERLAALVEVPKSPQDILRDLRALR